MMTDANGEVIVELKDLCKSYGEVNAVKNLSLQVQKGEIFGFLGFVRLFRHKIKSNCWFFKIVKNNSEKRVF